MLRAYKHVRGKSLLPSVSVRHVPKACVSIITGSYTSSSECPRQSVLVESSNSKSPTQSSSTSAFMKPSSLACIGTSSTSNTLSATSVLRSTLSKKDILHAQHSLRLSSLAGLPSHMPFACSSFFSTALSSPLAKTLNRRTTSIGNTSKSLYPMQIGGARGISCKFRLFTRFLNNNRLVSTITR